MAKGKYKPISSIVPIFVGLGFFILGFLYISDPMLKLSLWKPILLLIVGSILLLAGVTMFTSHTIFYKKNLNTINGILLTLMGIFFMYLGILKLNDNTGDSWMGPLQIIVGLFMLISGPFVLLKKR